MIIFPTIAVLITCHNRKEKTILCLQSLFNQIGLCEEFILEVFLVDDASTDGSSEAIRLQFPQVNIIQGSGNLYWNRGMHLAWKTANKTKDFDYYLWLNDDTFLINNAIFDLLKSAELTYNKSVICGSTISNITEKISYGGLSTKGLLINPNGELQEVVTFNGNVVLIPDFVFSIVGNLDIIFPHAIGDFDYGLRVRKAGLKSFISPYFVGTCEGNNKLPIWCDPKTPILNRIFNLYSPLGNSHPYFYFIFELKYYGIYTSLKHFFSIHLRLLFPKLWLKRIR
jgi:GT2 family glycosyltransferase